MSITLITPTRNRAHCFLLLQQWMMMQTKSWDQWIVVNDGTEEYNYFLGQEVYKKEYDKSGGHSLCQNILHAIPHVRGSKILIAEDDDYYRPDYIETMNKLLDDFSLVGEGRAKYYNVEKRLYKQFHNTEHASLAQTGMRREILPLLTEACLEGSPFIDLKVWSLCTARKKVFLGLDKHIGIKKMPGEPGIGIGHKDSGSPDKDLSIFNELKIPEVYMRYYEHYRSPQHANGDLIVPSQTLDCRKPFQGRLDKKPWQYDITVAIPHIGSVDLLKRVVDLLYLQSGVSCYFLIIDTGSLQWETEQIERLRFDNVEIHYIKSHGFENSSECIAVAMDLAFALCRTEYLFCTHNDCFMKRKDWLAYLKNRCGPRNPVVGYEMSDRSAITQDWRGMVSHTSTMLHMPTLLSKGISWSFQRYAADKRAGAAAGGWPDTETMFNWSLKECGITPELIGPEPNHKRQIDENVDHVRSYSSYRIYKCLPSSYGNKIDEYMEQAIKEADERIEKWRLQT